MHYSWSRNLCSETSFSFSQIKIYSVVKVCLDIRPTADKKNASSNRVQTISGFADSIINSFMCLLYSTVSEKIFGNTFFHTHKCAAEIVLIISSLHTQILLAIAHKFPHPHLSAYKNVQIHSQFPQQVSKWQIFCHSQWQRIFGTVVIK